LRAASRVRLQHRIGVPYAATAGGAKGMWFGEALLDMIDGLQREL
jgi:hypothetical protein